MSSVVISSVSRIISLLICAYMTVVWWFILKKAGDKGWKALIPIYGNYCECKAVDSIPLFWAGFVFVIIDRIIRRSILTDAYGVSIGAYRGLSLLDLVIALYLFVRFSMNTAKAFNKSGGFTAGLIFLPYIFLGILAFGQAKHKNQIENAEEANFQDQV